MNTAAGIHYSLHTKREVCVCRLRRALADVRGALKKARRELFEMSCALQRRPETLQHTGARVLSLTAEIQELEQRQDVLEEAIQQLE